VAAEPPIDTRGVCEKVYPAGEVCFTYAYVAGAKHSSLHLKEQQLRLLIGFHEVCCKNIGGAFDSFRTGVCAVCASSADRPAELYLVHGGFVVVAQRQ